MPYIGNQGQPSVFMLSRFLSQDMGQLFDYVTYVLDLAKRPLVSYVNFTLINAYARFWHFSWGYSPPPQNEVICSTAGLVLTFALTRNEYNENTVWNPSYKERLPKWSYAWGLKLNQYQYFSISVPFTTLKDCNMEPLLPLNMRYVYNVISSLTKNYVLHQNSHPFLDNMWYNYNALYNLTFADVLNRYTIKHLPYCKYIWQYATNLISTSIDYNVALYYFLYIYDDSDVPTMDRVENDMLGHILFGSNSIKTLLQQSIELYNSNREAANLLLVAALYGRLSKGQHYYKELLTIHNSSNFSIQKDDAEAIMKGLITYETLEAQ